LLPVHPLLLLLRPPALLLLPPALLLLLPPLPVGAAAGPAAAVAPGLVGLQLLVLAACRTAGMLHGTAPV
jgi:hypothetical protein